MNYRKLEELIEEKKFTQKEFADKIGMSRTGVIKMIQNKTLKVRVLERIAEAFEVPLAYFFEEDNDVRSLNEPASQYRFNKNDLNKIINDLREQINKKDDQISFLQHLIEQLQK